MKRNFVVGLFGSFVGLGMLLILLSATGIVGARSAEVRSDVSRANDVSAATPLTSTFTYQGQLKNGGTAVNGSCQMAFRLYDAFVSGSLIGIPITTTVPITNGLFTVGLNFGSTAFNGSGRWLDINMDCGNGFVPLTPRQAVTAAPYSLFALSTSALQSYPVTTTAPSSGQILKWNGSAWTPGTDAGGTAYSAGFGLTLIGSQFNVNTATVQSRISNSCLAGNAIRVVNTNGSVTCQSVNSNFWGLTGNAGTNPSTNFLGTTDKVTLTIRVSNTVAYRIVPAVDPGSGFAPNIIGGYGGNTVTPGVYGATIAGGGVSGYVNSVGANGNYATVSGGYANTASGFAATVGGGCCNTASGDRSTVGGGFQNTASGDRSTVGGGQLNIASGNRGTVGGGYGNTANNFYATVSGGENNTASGDSSIVSGGENNTASGNFAIIGGGLQNIASNDYATVAGGYANTANGITSMILGGSYNTVTGTNSMAGGHGALANGDGCFAWGDNSTSNVIDCQGDNLWSIRATGGFYFRPSSTVLCSLVDASGWQCFPPSDRNAKQDFVAVNPRQVLNQVAALPIEKWAYIDDATHIQHIGPMAQDFYAAFNIGADDKHINPVDSIGVALAAIQGLYQVVQAKDTQIAALQQQNIDLATRVSNLEHNTTGSNPQAPPEPFIVSTLLSVVALIAVGWMWLQQRRSKRGQS